MYVDLAWETMCKAEKCYPDLLLALYLYRKGCISLGQGKTQDAM